MTEDDAKLIRQCLRASVDGPFFDEEEFHTLFGLTRAEVSRAADTWRPGEWENSMEVLAINNALANLQYYPHRCEAQWSDYISAPKKDLNEVFSRWKKEWSQELERRFIRIVEAACEEGCPVAGHPEQVAHVARRHWLSSGERQVNQDSKTDRIADLTQGLIEEFEADPELVGPLEVDYRYLATKLADVCSAHADI